MDIERASLPLQILDRVRVELAEPAATRGTMFGTRTWPALAAGICLLIAAAWMAFYLSVNEPREAHVEDDIVDQKPNANQPNDRPRDTNVRSEYVPPRTRAKLTYQRVAMQPAAPEDYERLAVNGKTKVHVAKPDPATNTPCRITVLQKGAAEWRKQWAVNAVNPIQPARAYVSDDGRCVVTIGNASGGPDHTKEQLVIYHDGKLKDRYALEDILPGHVPADNSPRTAICPGGWWRDSFEFTEDQKLCLFVDFARQWVLVDLKQAALINVTDSARARCDKRARRDIYETLARDIEGHHYPTYRRLIRFLRAEDRSLFERLLTQPNSLGLPSGYSDEYFMTSNQERDLAELALQAIDAGKRDAIGAAPHPPFNSEIKYQRLGSLKIAATFPRPVSTGDGIIVIWLEPVRGPNEDIPPANAIGIDLEYQFPSPLKSAGKPLHSPVTFYFRGVAPGRYRIRGYWDRKTRYKHLIEKNYWRRTGESTVTSDTNVDVEIGETAVAAVVFE